MAGLPEQLRTTQILPGSLAIWSLGQMGVAIKGPDALIVIDPCLSDIVRESFGDWWARAYPPPLQAQELGDVDYFLISHEHLDHLDPATLAPGGAGRATGAIHRSGLVSRAADATGRGGGAHRGAAGAGGDAGGQHAVDGRAGRSLREGV